MNQRSPLDHPRDSSRSLLIPGARAFTLVEILISIMILALGVLGLGVLFPVVIREQRMGVDASTGIVVAGAAKDILTTPKWGGALPSEPVTPTTATTRPQYAVGISACYSFGANASCVVTSRAACIAAGGHFAEGRNDYLGITCSPTPTYALLRNPVLADRGMDGATSWLWEVLRDHELTANSPIATIPDGLGKGFNGNRNFQPYGQGEWFTNLIDQTDGAAKIGFPGKVFYGPTQIDGFVHLPVQQRLYPQSEKIDPQFVWDFAVQRVSRFNYYYHPGFDDLRAVIFVRRVDPRIRLGGTAKSVLDAITNYSGTVAAADRRLPLGEDANGNPTFDGTDGSGGLRYSGIRSCEVEYWYNPAIPAQNHTDRLYIPTVRVDGTVTLPDLKILFAQMKQPGQKLVDNLGNIYTVIGSGNETGVAAQDIDSDGSADYIRVDPPITVPQRRAAPATQAISYGNDSNNPGSIDRAIWSVSFTPQVPVAVTIVDLIKGVK